MGDVQRARRILRDFQPDLVLGMGCYASFAPGIAAHGLGVPLVIHEQNAVLGLTNRLLARFADRILLSFPRTQGIGPWVQKATLVGIPVRRDIRERERRPPWEGRTLLVLGGSRGSRLLVEVVLRSAPLLAEIPGLRLWVSVGWAAEPAVVERGLREAGLRDFRVDRRIEDMGRALAEARLVVARAGASTIGELLVSGRPAILVPWSGAAGNHQEANARAVSGRGGCVLLPEPRVEKLGRVILSLWFDEIRLRRLSEAALGLARPGAAHAAAVELLKAYEVAKCSSQVVCTS